MLLASMLLASMLFASMLFASMLFASMLLASMRFASMLFASMLFGGPTCTPTMKSDQVLAVIGSDLLTLAHTLTYLLAYYPLLTYLLTCKTTTRNCITNFPN